MRSLWARSGLVVMTSTLRFLRALMAARQAMVTVLPYPVSIYRSILFYLRKITKANICVSLSLNCLVLSNA